MRRREPAPGIFRLSLPLPFPGLNAVNAYLLTEGDSALLFDCGMHLPDDPDSNEGWDHLVRSLAACDVEPGQITRLVLSHTHIDHYGLAARLKDETGCTVLIHRNGDRELELLRHPEQRIAELKALLLEHGVADSEIEELTAFEDWRRFVSGVIDADEWLEGDEKISVGRRTWEVVHTPGHARSHICLWSAADELLLSGDHLLPSITPHIDFERSGDPNPLGDFLDSLERIEELAPRVVLPGHGRPFEDGEERARAVRQHHERRLGSILQVIRHEPHTAADITDAIFGTSLLNFQKRLALGEALAHLAYLRLNGEIERLRDDDGTLLYQKVRRRPPAPVEE